VHTKLFWIELKEGNYLDDLGIDGLIILRSPFKKWDGEHGLDCCDSGYWQVADYREDGMQFRVP
jgi:hypothetical protein